MYSLVLSHIFWKNFAELGDEKTLEFHHCVYFSFDLLVTGQRSLQALFGVQLWVSPLVNVLEHLKWNIDLMKLLTALLDVLKAGYHRV